MGINDFETGGDYKPKDLMFNYQTADVKNILNRKYLEPIATNGNEPTSEMIKTIIAENKNESNRTRNAYERYKASAKGVPIFSRTLDNKDKVNNKLNNDFMGEIIDTKVGYMYGTPIKYVQSEKDIGKDDYVWEFNRRNNVEDLDAETGKMASICGYASRLLYIDTEKNERAVNLDPWEVIFVANDSIIEPSYAFRPYVTTVFREGKFEETTKVEFYNADNVIYYELQQDGEYREIDRQKNLYRNFCPVIGFPNNEEYMGDCDKALALLDAYDLTLSDVSSEITQIRLAYMVFTGDVEVDAEFMKQLEQTGGLNLPEGAGASFLTKNLNDGIIENHLNRLTDNIARFTKHVNLTDDKFGGDLSGVAIKYKLTALENKAKYSERKFIAALRRLYQVLGGSVKANVDYMNLDFKFVRNLPVNIADEVNTAKNLLGITSKETMLSVLSFVADPLTELEKIEDENEGTISLLDKAVTVDGQRQTESIGGNGETSGT
jgi:SPP1 family phage portal protein